jgi:hypothetical protein
LSNPEVENPVPVQDVALTDVHVKVDDPPLTMLVGLATNVSLTFVGPGGATRIKMPAEADHKEKRTNARIAAVTRLFLCIGYRPAERRRSYDTKRLAGRNKQHRPDTAASRNSRTS